jgi:predicted dienelactone hydrolase
VRRVNHLQLVAACIVVAVSCAACSTAARSVVATTRPSSPEETFAAVHPPYRVGFETLTLVDHLRTTPQNGTAPALGYRTLSTYVLYPASGTPTASPVSGATPSHDGNPFPVIVFAHGLDSNGPIYEPLLYAWAKAGFVVVAPTFPLSSISAPGGDTATDLINQPGDLTFVLTQILALSGRAGNLLSGMVDPRRIGAVGHSLGAMTVLAWAENTCCEDKRVDAAVIIDGTETPTFGTDRYFAGHTVPILVVHGTADETIPYANGKKIYADAKAPKYMLSLIGAPHVSFLQFSLTPEAPPKWEGVDVQSVVDFLEGELDHNPSDLSNFSRVANVAQVAKLQADP